MPRILLETQNLSPVPSLVESEFAFLTDFLWILALEKHWPGTLPPYRMASTNICPKLKEYIPI
jgi:hypothetical protein